MSTAMLSPRAEAVQQGQTSELRIALMLPNLAIGGSQEIVCGLARAFAAKGCETVVAALFEGGPLESELHEQGTRFEVFDLSRRPARMVPLYLADMWRLCRRLREFFVKHRINVIQTNNLGSQDFLVLAVARQMGIPVITFNFQDERVFAPGREDHILSRIQRRLYRISRRWASDYVAVSPETKLSMIRQMKIKEDQVTTICNAVDVDKFDRQVDGQHVRGELGLGEDTKLLISVATLKPQKGHRYLIDAARSIVQREPRAHLLFVGDGELRSVLEQQVNTSGLAEHVHFLGSRRDVLELLLASDVFILPSLFEGLSVALLEAMASGIPVIATAVSGTTTVVNSDRVAVLVPPADVDTLANAVIDLLAKSPNELRAQCSAAQERVVEEFSLNRQACNYIALYERLLADKSRQDASH